MESIVEDYTSYKNRNNGIWARGELRLYKNLKMADNGIGFTQASGNLGRSLYTSRVVDSTFVGESENIGNPRTPAEMAYGRSLPHPEVADFPIRGYEFYDYHHELDNDTFVNYQDNATRKTGAISYLLFTSFGMSSNNTVQRAKFINAKPVYFPPIDNRWSNDDYGNKVYKTSVFNDKDGSITGVPNSYIVNITGIDVDEACEVKPTWNAAVCKGDIGRMTVGGGGGAIGFGGFGGGGAPGAGGPGAGGPRPPVLAPVLVVLVVLVHLLPPAPPGLLLHLLSSRLPRVVAESEVPLHQQGRQWFSAAMARNSPPMGKPTYARAPSTR